MRVSHGGSGRRRADLPLLAIITRADERVSRERKIEVYLVIARL